MLDMTVHKATGLYVKDKGHTEISENILLMQKVQLKDFK